MCIKVSQHFHQSDFELLLPRLATATILCFWLRAMTSAWLEQDQKLQTREEKGGQQKKKELSKKEMYMFQTSTGNSRKSQPALHVKVNRRWPLVPHKLFRGFRLHPKLVELGYEIISQATCLSSLAVQLANWREWFPVWAAIQNMAVKIWTIQRLFFSQDLFFFSFLFHLTKYFKCFHLAQKRLIKNTQIWTDGLSNKTKCRKVIHSSSWKSPFSLQAKRTDKQSLTNQIGVVVLIINLNQFLTLSYWRNWVRF